MAPSFLVTGATGQQGGHTARILLSAGYGVHVLVRDLASLAAQTLRSLGATVFQGDFSDLESIFTAAQGCTGVFLNVSPLFTDPQGEQKHAQNIVDACRNAGVKKIVQSSVTHVEDQEKFVGFDKQSWMGTYYASKLACEQAVKNAEGFDSWTILKPARLLSTYISPSTVFMFPDLATKGVIRTALKPDLKQAVLDPMDVGKFAAKALSDESSLFHQALVPLAVQDLTMGEIVVAMNRALGEDKIILDYIKDEEAQSLKVMNPIIGSEVFLNANGLQVNRDHLQKYGIELNTPAQFFNREKQALRKALSG